MNSSSKREQEGTRSDEQADSHLLSESLKSKLRLEMVREAGERIEK